jgi:hypothetical protein
MKLFQKLKVTSLLLAYLSVIINQSLGLLIAIKV